MNDDADKGSETNSNNIRKKSFNNDEETLKNIVKRINYVTLRIELFD